MAKSNNVCMHTGVLICTVHPLCVCNDAFTHLHFLQLSLQVSTHCCLTMRPPTVHLLHSLQLILVLVLQLTLQGVQLLLEGGKVGRLTGVLELEGVLLLFQQLCVRGGHAILARVVCC